MRWKNVNVYHDYIQDRRIRRTYSGRKQKATGYVYITGSPYSDYEV